MPATAGKPRIDFCRGNRNKCLRIQKFALNIDSPFLRYEVTYDTP